MRITFELPAHVGEDVVVCGDFNDWSRVAHRMGRVGDRFRATITVDSGTSYRFRYLIDNNRWENDEAADFYVPNNFGSEDAVIET